MKKLKWILYTRPFIAFVYHFVRLYSLTFRFRVINESTWQDCLRKGHTVILCTWHQQFFSAIRHFKNYARFNPGLMISRSKDGELISGVANRTGWHTPRGSSSRGGKHAMESMIQHLRTYGFGAHILDGPTGPIGKVKPGIIRMAHQADAAVVPFHVTAEQAWFFNSWDRFMLPKPFSRVTIRFNNPIQLEPTNVKEAFEVQRKNLEQLLKPSLIV